MSLHVIVGAGPVGNAVARLLVEQGHRVRMVTRSGGGPADVERVAADASDADRLGALAEGAEVLYNCANPQYHRWLTDWPPLASALLTAAGRSGAVLATTSTLYGYGPVDGPITPATPLSATHPKLRMRADMWRDALAAHRAGRIRATEVRGSDYVEANGVLSFGLAEGVLAGRRAFSPALWASGLFSPIMREMRTTSYQWRRPFVMDTTHTERTFGLAPTPLDTALAAVDATAGNASLTPRR
jgi:NAD(P)-dependent dehydrogenase (short-subunit alcohol dehydrogenase family)